MFVDTNTIVYTRARIITCSHSTVKSARKPPPRRGTRHVEIPIDTNSETRERSLISELSRAILNYQSGTFRFYSQPRELYTSRSRAAAKRNQTNQDIHSNFFFFFIADSRVFARTKLLRNLKYNVVRILLRIKCTRRVK